MAHKPSKELINVSAPANPIAKATFRPWGNSLALRFPTEVLKMAGFSEGVEVGFHVSDEGEIVLRPTLPAADNQKGLRALFLSLRGSAPDGVKCEEEEFYEPMGDEMI
ncbi:AbrB/MazE/SpoVT family DNA-binding domain-containing protein [Paenibacillus aurantiacus]|uniref:AbrB/MazE/SpoVT family DNA-binding domain-containing protein n=1 Tax=Paenibacillus aurantiacus TaxID=1936118 RepID=A0ABV5KKC6_9BACL